MNNRRVAAVLAVAGIAVSALPLVDVPPVAAASSTSTTRLSLNAGVQIAGGDNRRPAYGGQWVAWDTASPTAVSTDPASVALTGFTADTNARRDVVVRSRATANAPTRMVSIDLFSAQRAGDSWDPALNVDGRFVAFLSNGTYGDGNGEGNERPCDDPSPDESAAGQGNEARDLNGALTDVYVRDRDADAKQNIAGSVGVYDQRFLPGQTPGTLPYCGTKTKLVSVGTDELQADKPSGYRAVQDGSVGISDSGRFVVFATTAKLVTTSSTGAVANQDADNVLDVYVRDRDTEGDGVFDERDTASTYLVSLPTASNTAAGYPSISADGTMVAYEDGTNIRVVRLSITNGNPTVTTIGAPFAGSRPSIAATGADGAVVYQRTAGTVTTAYSRAITVAGAGTIGSERTLGVGALPQVDRTGRLVAFSTGSGTAQSVVATGIAGGSTSLISRALGSTSNGNAASGANGIFPEVAVQFDSDGTASVGFSSDASNLVTGDTNGVRDVFERGWAGLISVATTATPTVSAARGVQLTDVPAAALTFDRTLLATVVGAPAGAIRSLPSGGLRSLPVGGLRSLPGGGLRSLPGGGLRSLQLQSLPLGGLRSLPGGGLRSLPAGALRSLDVSLSQLTLSLDGLTFADLLVGSPYANVPLQSVTMRDLLLYIEDLKVRDVATLSPIQQTLLTLTIVELDRDGTFLQGVSLVSLFLGSYTLADLNAAAFAGKSVDWCSSLPSGTTTQVRDAVCATTSTLFALDLAGADLTKLNLDDIDISKLVPNDVLTELAKLRPIPSATGISTYLANFLDARDFPWEQVALKYPAGIAGRQTGANLEPFARGGLAMWTSTVDTFGAAPVVVSFTLPMGFAYQPGTAGCGPVPAPGSAPTCAATVGVTTTNGIDTVTVGFTAPGGPIAVRVGARPTPLLIGEPGSAAVTTRLNGIGTTARVQVNFDGNANAYDSNGTSAVPPVAVFDPWTASQRPLDPGSVYFGEIGSPTEEDQFQVALPADTPAGTKLTVRLSNLASDLDLTLFVSDPTSPTSLPGGALRSLPAGALRSLPGGALRSLPSGGLRSLNGYLRSLPLEDVGAGGQTALPPEVLQDIPQSLPGGYVRSLSANRDTQPEIIDTTVGTAVGSQPLRYTVRVTGYNDATGPYVLRVITDAPVNPSPAQCNAIGDAANLSLGSLEPDTTTLVLYPKTAIGTKYPGTTATLDAKLAALAGAEASLGRKVQVAEVNVAPGFDWTTDDACSPVRANAVASSISDELIDLALPAAPAPAPNLQYVVIVGGDDVLPMARVADNTAISNESDYAGSFGTSNPLARSAAASRVLTDNVYGDLNPGTIGDAALLVPELAVGRLVETPAQIATQIDRFVVSGGAIDASTKTVAAYDFLLDSGAAIADNLGVADRSLINDTWRSTDLLGALGANSRLISLNAHFDHQGLLTAAGDKGTLLDGLPDQVGLNDVANLNTALVFSVGCHSGLNVPATYDTNGRLRKRDWADELSTKSALYVANTGFGYGDSTANALSEQLMTTFSNRISTLTAGQALVAAKQDYAGGMGTYVSYDEKVLHESTMYGLPMYSVAGLAPPATQRLAAAAAPAAAPVSASFATTAAGSASASLQTASVTVTNNGTNGAGFPQQPAVTAPVASDLKPERQLANGFPIVPKVQVDVTATDPTLVARGAIFTGLTSSNPVPVSPKYARAVFDQAAREQPSGTNEVYFPTTFQTVNRVGGPDGGEDRLVLLPGQIRSTATGFTRTDFTSMQASVFYGPDNGDLTPPLIDSVVADQVVPPVVDGSPVPGTRAVVFRVNTSDAETGVWRVVVLYDTGGVWVPIELQKVAGRADEWVGSIQTDLVDGPRFIVQAVNNDGRVATATDKGRYYKVTGTRPTLVTVIRGIQGTNGWYRGGPTGVGTPVIAEILGQPGAAFTSTLRLDGTTVGADNQPYSTPLKLQNAAGTVRDGRFTVIAASNGASLTTDVKVDGTAPTITATVNGTALSTDQANPTPVIALGPGALSFTCADATSGLASSSATVGNAPPVACGAATLPTGAPVGLRTLTATATDNAGNTATATFYATIVDNSAPDVAVSPTALSNNEATGPGGASVPVVVNVTASDAIDPGPFTVVCTRPGPNGTTIVVRPDGSSQQFPLGVTTVTCTATDASGNTGTGTFTVTVSDTQGPAVGVPAGATAEATGPTGAVVTFDTSASDIVDGPRPVTCSQASGTTFAIGSTLVTCTATDNAGNPGSASFTVTVTDTKAPVLTLSPPNDIRQEATGPSGAVVTFNVTGTDTVSGSVTVTCVPPSGSTFPLGTTSVICSATDAAGNTGSITFNVIVEDKTAPAITTPSLDPVEATGVLTPVSFAVTATDTVSGAVAPSCSNVSGSGFPVGTTTVTCTATDGQGNTSTASFAVVVRDSTAPRLSLPANQVAEATGPSGATVTFTVTATDAVTASPTITCSRSSGVFPVGITTVTCTASDSAGNTSPVGSFTVTVRDTTPPTLTVPASFTVASTSPSGAAVTFVVSATDLVSGTRPVTCTRPSAGGGTQTVVSGATFAIGTTVVTCTASDTANPVNTATRTFSVTVTPFVYRYSGFYSPVNMGSPDSFGFPSVVNGMNAGRTLPLKFEIFAPNGTELTDPTQLEVRVVTEDAFRTRFPGLTLPARNRTPNSTSLCGTKPVVPLNSADPTSALKFSGGQFNVGIKTDSKVTTPNCYVAYAMVSTDGRPGITGLVTLTP
jgi:hypothetical protein